MILPRCIAADLTLRLELLKRPADCRLPSLRAVRDFLPANDRIDVFESGILTDSIKRGLDALLPREYGRRSPRLRPLAQDQYSLRPDDTPWQSGDGQYMTNARNAQET